MTRINKEQYLNLGILAKEYEMTRTQLVNLLVQNAWEKYLEERTDHDSTF